MQRFAQYNLLKSTYAISVVRCLCAPSRAYSSKGGSGSPFRPAQADAVRRETNRSTPIAPRRAVRLRKKRRNLQKVSATDTVPQASPDTSAAKAADTTRTERGEERTLPHVFDNATIDLPAESAALMRNLRTMSAGDAVPCGADGRPLELKQATAYCTATSFDFPRLLQFLTSTYVPSSFADGVIHVHLEEEGGDIYFFREGTVVFWGTTSAVERQVLEALAPFEIEPLASEAREFETMDFYTSDIHASHMDGDTIFVEGGDDELMRLNMLAFSYGLSRSTMVSVLEEKVDAAIEQLRYLPDELLKPMYPLLDRKQRRSVNKQMRDIMFLRSSINLHSELQDVPELYWDQPDREHMYEQIAHRLDIEARVELLNRKLDIGRELVELLRIQLQESYSHRLEWFIIILIGIEIVFSVVQH